MKSKHTTPLVHSVLMHGYRFEAVILIVLCVGYVMAYHINPGENPADHFKSYAELCSTIADIALLFHVIFIALMGTVITRVGETLKRVLALCAFDCFGPRVRRLSDELLQMARSEMFTDRDYLALVGMSADAPASRRRVHRTASSFAMLIAILLCIKGGGGWPPAIGFLILAIVRRFWHATITSAVVLCDMLADELAQIPAAEPEEVG